MEAIFQTLKKPCVLPQFLSTPKAEEKFIVDTGASNVKIRGVLSQIQDRRGLKPTTVRR
jgi:hypothetical protein